MIYLIIMNGHFDCPYETIMLVSHAFILECNFKFLIFMLL